MPPKKKKKRKAYSKTKPVSKQTFARRIGLLFLGAALLGGIFYLVFCGLSFLLWRNSNFVLKHLEVHSNGRLSAAQLEEYAGVMPGVNLFDVQLDEVASNLGQVALVEKVLITRKLPDTLRVQVSERVALAQVNWKWRAMPFLIDRSGVVLPATQQGRSLPMIEGVALHQLRPGERVEDSRILFVLSLLSECQDPNLSSVLSFERFDLRKPDFFTAALTSGVSVRFPYHSLRGKLLRLVDVISLAREQGHRLKTVDLVPDGINVPTS